jgi:phosphonopyruvate decarboxylase
MITPKKFYESLLNSGLDTFVGVPDSLLKAFCAYVTDNSQREKNIITANEGNAIGFAAGHYIATRKPAVVYMQNSGLGNTVNPLTSLTDPQAYSIPALLIVGWRGEPGVKDEPQHKKMGEITCAQLELLGIPYSVIDKATENVAKIVESASAYMQENSSPYAIVVRKGTFEAYELQNVVQTNYELSREKAVQLVADSIGETAVIVSTTGKTSRELFEYRVENDSGHQRDFLTIGSMGHASSIALGVAIAKPNKQIYCFDGDGAALMHMGALPVIADLALKNYKHIIFNNGAHDSVGGQPTVAHKIDLPKIAMSSGYKAAFQAQTAEEVRTRLSQIKDMDGPVMLEILVNKGARKDLGRPTKTPLENKAAFMKNLNNGI